ncbi:MAG: TIM barrel protein [Alphaproteobacteria bacterium]|nr:TIM barrel protein [Alphaproteobacteria bacterium]
MPRFCANISFLFTELPFLERFEAAAKAGFEGVEFLFPYEWPAQQLRDLADANGLEVVLFNIWPGDWASGWRGLAGVRGQQGEFLKRLDEALCYASVLGCRQLHAMAGLERHGANTDTLVANIGLAAERASSAGITILTEPINRGDMPGYLVHRTQQACDIIAAVGARNVGLQLDLYHRHVEEGAAANAIGEFQDLTAHYQIAGPPNRDEPQVGSVGKGALSLAGEATGELDYEPLFRNIDASGYQGWVGCEYRPRGDTVSGLSWFFDLSGQNGRSGEI